MAGKKFSIQITLFSFVLSMLIAVSAGFARQPRTVDIMTFSGDRASDSQLSSSQQTAEPISQNKGNANNQQQNVSWKDFEPPNRATPGRRHSDSVRCPRCSNNVIALIPQSTMGRTLLAPTTFLYYLPETIDKKVEFEFEWADESDRTIYKTSFRMITQAGGIVSVNLPAENVASLEVGKNYLWYLTIKCNPNDRELNDVSGWINRVEMTADLKSQLDMVESERDRLSIYAKELLWYEYISTLANLRLSQPNDLELKAKWVELLKEVELEKIAKEPLLQTQLIPIE